MQGGHILPPPVQRWSGLPPFNNEAVLHCDGRAINLYQSIISWYEDKLRGRKGVAASIPDFCVSLDLDHGVALQQLPENRLIELPATAIRPMSSGLLQPSRFIPLQQVQQASALVGIPRLHLENAEQLPTLFAALMVRRADGKREVLSEQVTPLKGRANTELAAVSAHLQPGDTLGLRISGFSGQYLFNGSWQLASSTLQGAVELPQLLPHRQ
jgi:ABC-2 type transport system ATP-binding protein